MFFDQNSYPIYKQCIDGRHFLVYPIYFIQKVNRQESSVNQELKLEEPEHKIETKIENKEHKNYDPMDFNTYMFPGQSKNYYKNIGNQFASFIINYFDKTEILKDPKISKFLKIKKQKYTKMHFQQLMKSKKARQLIKIYFGNYLWCSSILKRMKSDVEFYLSLNQQIFRRKPKQKIKTEFNKFPGEN
ncbi:unnamed protein product [Paramecium primaurelia]|uniref:Uncharacterized protein n=1 Tax=Paramecium primaurelia TaxID=5886 RepID=A0A8S1JML7_PARPR|nr:unnamed protein product [Paramecium primaurelia]